MKAYKATNKDMTCNNFQYELNKEFVHEGKLSMCESGFHFCKELKNINFYYPFSSSDNRFFEIEILDNAETIHGEDKSVTNKIKFIRELDQSDFDNIGVIRKFDSNGNMIHYKASDGYEFWWEYDSNGNMIHTKNSKGFERWWKYDSDGNLIYYRNSNGLEAWWKFDSNGNVIHFRDSDDFEEWKEYDSNGNMIYFKNSDGFEEW